MTYTYRAYGLTIEVPFECPALTPVGDTPQAAADVVVRDSPVPRRLPARWAGGAWWDASPGSFLLRGGERAGRFLVGAGNVTFERGADCDDAVLAEHFTGQVLAALLRHRGFLVLHANAVQCPDGVVVIGGDSGAGKSTTLAALLGRGCRMLSDDVTALRPGAEPGVVEVVPGAAQTHLVKRSAEVLGYQVSAAEVRPWRRGKTAISTHADMAPQTGQLRALYVLRPAGGDLVRVTRTSGADTFRALHECLYGPMFAKEHPALFPLMSAVAADVPFFRLDRPASRWSVDEVADAVLTSAALDRVR